MTQKTIDREFLMAVFSCANHACKAAVNHPHRDKKFKNEAVNWADIKCVSAEYYEDDTGNTGYRVWLEECSPSTTSFRTFISEYLEKHNFYNVDVECEW